MAATSGGGVRRLTDGEGSEASPTVAPDGSRIAMMYLYGPIRPSDTSLDPIRAQAA